MNCLLCNIQTKNCLDHRKLLSKLDHQVTETAEELIVAIVNYAPFLIPKLIIYVPLLSYLMLLDQPVIW
jgi:hypothetical protein